MSNVRLRYFLLPLFLALGCSVSIAQLSGPLSGILLSGVYTVEGDIFVQQEDSLLIEPGVVLEFSGYYSFEVFGHLHAAGTEHDSIRFVPLQSSIDWAGIKFYSPPPDSSRLEYCLISGSADRGIFCQYSSPILERCTIRDNSSPGYGGGIDVENAAPLITNCLIRGNFSLNFGGGIALRQSSSALLEYCLIDSNNSNEADGMGLYCYSSDPIIRFCAVNHNERGGARLTNSNPSLYQCNFEGNGSEGIFVLNSVPTFDQCTFAENLIGIQLSESDASMHECTVRNNQRSGVDCHNSEPIINFCMIEDNGMAGIQVYSDAHPILDKTSICANGGSGVYCPGGGVSLNNCIIFGNDGYGIEFGYGDEVQYCDIWGNDEGVYYGNSPTGFAQISAVNANGDSCDVFSNIFLDPEFVYPTQNDYRLQWGSPCIDAGDPASTPDPDSTVADLGAYYYNQNTPLRVLLTPLNAPIVIPPQGGIFDYYIQVTNIAPQSLDVVVWCDVTLPNGVQFGPVLGPVSLNLGSEVTIGRERTQTVPAGAPAGTYTYNAYATAESDTSTDSFTFEKLGTDGLNGISGWLNTGDSFDKKDDSRIASADAPDNCILIQSYPNPFNAATVLSFQLQVASFVKLEVFDVKGRNVGARSPRPYTVGFGESDLRWYPPGTHQISFDGSGLASGIYLARLQAGNLQQTWKLVLIK